MIDIIDKLMCCGCTACEQVCPRKCISLEEDTEGFLYPKIDEGRCIDCHLCEKVCPVLNPNEERVPLKVYAAYNKNEIIRSKSASGGIFTIIAEKIINEGGVVFGVKFDENWDVVYGYTETLEGLEPFRRSKYVQAKVGNAYNDVWTFLKKGKKVLFTGTPCQIAALKKFVRTDYENLLTMDLICEGVPSPLVWRRYLNEEIAEQSAQFKKRPNTKIVVADINFRNKKRGWRQFAFCLELNQVDSNTGDVVDKSIVIERTSYMRALMNYLDLRPICYQCPFKSCKSGSDLTIGDYWGIYKLHPEFCDNRGTSMVYINTNKGTHYFDKQIIECMETTYQEAFPYNNIITSVKKHPNRERFFEELDNCKSFEKLVWKLLYTPLQCLKLRIKRMVKVWIGEEGYEKLKKIRHL